MAELTSKYFTTSDGVKLHYFDAGSGQTLVMIPGWSQSAEEFKYQLQGLSDQYRTIALDMRGHGKSDKAQCGYKISRLAKDLHEFLIGLNLENVAVLGHSMGCSVIWNYWDLFGPERLAKLILVDQSPFLTSNPSWNAEELEASGALFDPQSMYDTVNGLAGPNGEETTRAVIGGMFTSAMSHDDREWIFQQNFLMPRECASALLYNHCTQDWSDLIPRIDIPTLIVSGRVSAIPWKSQAWIHKQIPGSKLEIFEEEEGGQHFMFFEGWKKFNQVVADFMG